MTRKRRSKASSKSQLVGISTRIPRELQTRLKLYCAKNHLTVQELTIGLYTKALGK